MHAFPKQMRYQAAPLPDGGFPSGSEVEPQADSGTERNHAAQRGTIVPTKSPTADLWKCGHERTPENTTRCGITRRCKRCQSLAMRRVRDRRNKPTTKYASKEGPPIADLPNATRMELANKDFLRAMWKHHKRIMLVAKACGRQVEMP